jgi:cytochrome c
MFITVLFMALAAICSGAGAAAADSAGAAELQKCKICHALDAPGAHVGPSLHGVFGRKAGTESSYKASEAMQNSGIVWDEDSLAKFLRDPKGSVPGNRMSFPGIKDEATLRDLIAQLKQATQ